MEVKYKRLEKYFLFSFIYNTANLRKNIIVYIFQTTLYILIFSYRQYCLGSCGKFLKIDASKLTQQEYNLKSYFRNPLNILIFFIHIYLSIKVNIEI